jgi:hypothetical protein
MPQHTRTMSQQKSKISKSIEPFSNKVMSYMPQSIRSHLMKHEISGLSTALIIILLFAIILYTALIYFGVLDNPFSSLFAPKQNLQYFFF